MKKFAAIALAVVLVIAAGITGYIFYHEEDGMYSRSATQSFTLSKNSIAKWTFEADKDIRAYVKIEVVGAALTDQTAGKVLIKGSSGNGRKQIDAEALKDKKGSSISLPFRKGENNYLVFTAVECKSVQLNVTVTTHALKGHIRALGVETGKDYGL